MVLKFSFSVHYLYAVFYIYYQFGRLPRRQISGHACAEFSGLSCGGGKAYFIARSIKEGERGAPVATSYWFWTQCDPLIEAPVARLAQPNGLYSRAEKQNIPLSL